MTDRTRGLRTAVAQAERFLASLDERPVAAVYRLEDRQERTA